MAHTSRYLPQLDTKMKQLRRTEVQQKPGLRQQGFPMLLQNEMFLFF